MILNEQIQNIEYCPFINTEKIISVVPYCNGAYRYHNGNV
jgi:hypothetical protein